MTRRTMTKARRTTKTQRTMTTTRRTTTTNTKIIKETSMMTRDRLTTIRRGPLQKKLSKFGGGVNLTFFKILISNT